MFRSKGGMEGQCSEGNLLAAEQTFTGNRSLGPRV